MSLMDIVRPHKKVVETPPAAPVVEEPPAPRILHSISIKGTLRKSLSWYTDEPRMVAAAQQAFNEAIASGYAAWDTTTKGEDRQIREFDPAAGPKLALRRGEYALRSQSPGACRSTPPPGPGPVAQLGLGHGHPAFRAGELGAPSPS